MRMWAAPDLVAGFLIAFGRRGRCVLMTYLLPVSWPGMNQD